MRQESKISLICPRCNTRSEATFMSDNGVLTIVYDHDHVKINHAMTKGTFHPEPYCKHCPNPMFDHEAGVRYDEAFLIMCDSRLGEAIQKFNRLGAYTQWSCEGHYQVLRVRENGTVRTPEVSVPYILFSPEQPNVTKNLYRAAARIDQEPCITPELSWFNYDTGRRIKLRYTDLDNIEIAVKAQFGIDFDSGDWEAPHDQLESTLEMIKENRLQETYVEQLVHRKTAVNVYHQCMQARQDSFIRYVNALADEYEQLIKEGGSAND